MTRIILTAFAVLLIAACGRERAETPAPQREESAQGNARDKVGRIYHYVRSNIDGTEREDVYVFRKRVDFLEVYKARSECTNAALVTAELDMEKGFAPKLTGGRLLPGAKHEEFAFLTYDSAARRIDAVINLPDQEPLKFSVGVDHEPWHLYDFDFASLTVMAPHFEPRADFSFGLPLVIADPSRDEPLIYLGEAEATYRGEDTRAGRPAYRFALGGAAFGDFGGNIWLDAEEGHILDVETGIPNHIEYNDFKLALADIDDGGETAWVELLKAHFDGCE